MNYNDLRRGNVFEYEGSPYLVVGVEHITPGNWRGICQIKMKDVRTGAVVQRRFRPQDKVELVYVDKKEMQYLYKDGENYIFMDMASFEQIPLHQDVLGDLAQWLIPETMVSLEMYDGKPIGVELPKVMVLTVTETDPVIKGQTATNQYKSAVLENGVHITVPPFISVGEKLRVDTVEGKYMERAKE
jgi:elongation factor P